MELRDNKLNKEFSSIKCVGSQDAVIKLINDIMKNHKVDDEDLFVIEGLWAYEKIMKSSIRIRAFAFCPDFIKNTSTREMVRLFISCAEEVCIISSNLCSKLSGREGEQGFFLLCSMSQVNLYDIQLKKNNLLVVLDGLEKAGNIGTIIRSADAAGGDGVIICNNRVRKTNQKLIKSSMGSSFLIPVIESDIEETVSWLVKNDFKIIVTDLKAKESYCNIDYNGRVAIIVGNEIRGISDTWSDYSCERVIIPMFGGADSLNVGVAATLVVYEASFCQRHIRA